MTGPRPIHLLPLAARVAPERVLAVRPGGELLACDFYVEGAETGQEVPGGYRLGRLVNVDHHAPTARMARRISSTHLALRHVEAAPVPRDAVAVIHHTDCDSVLSSGIVAGRLAPEPEYGHAALAADHTGQEDPVADLLQALEDERDVDFSLACLAALRRGAPLPGRARRLLDERRRKRAEAERLAAGSAFHADAPLRWAVFDREIDGEFFPALLPDAIALLLACPMPGLPGRWLVKVRLGLAAPEGLSLHAVGLPTLDPAFGGRWNAGSNRRAGGTALAPEAYAHALAGLLRAALGPHPAA